MSLIRVLLPTLEMGSQEAGKAHQDLENSSLDIGSRYAALTAGADGGTTGMGSGSGGGFTDVAGTEALGHAMHVATVQTDEHAQANLRVKAAYDSCGAQTQDTVSRACTMLSQV